MFKSLLVNLTRQKLVSVSDHWESLHCSSTSATLVPPTDTGSMRQMECLVAVFSLALRVNPWF